MARLTKLEKRALIYAANEVLAGDPEEYFNGGCALPDPPENAEERKVVREAKGLARALSSAVGKLV